MKDEAQPDTYHPSFSRVTSRPQDDPKSSPSMLGRVLKASGFGSSKTKNSRDHRDRTLEDQLQQQQQLQKLQIPALSLTSVGNEGFNATSTSPGRGQGFRGRRQRPRPTKNNYLADFQRETQADDERDQDDEDEEEDDGGLFFGAVRGGPIGLARIPGGLAVPLHPAYEHRSHAAQSQEPPMSSYEDWLDDRQGMNDGQQNELRTKGEQQAQLNARPSLDGSIISSLSGPSRGGKKRGRAKKLSLKIGLGGRGTSFDQHSSQQSAGNKSTLRRGKSPSGGSRRYARSSGSGRARLMGLVSLASRLKLTKKHESIAKLQLTMLQSGLISLKKLDRDLQTFLPKSRMNSKELKEHVKLIRKYPVLPTIEYKFASRYETYVCRHAQQEANQAKNNYKKCIPYDYNRVVLRTIPGQSNSDYINASYVDSLLKPNAYIAAQGPNEKTLEDFWRMVWEQRSFVLVMLTKVFDFIKVMCNQYWPIEVNKSERYGNIEVTLLYEEPLADFVIRTLRLTYHRTSPSNTSNNQLTGQTGCSVQLTPGDDINHNVFLNQLNSNNNKSLEDEGDDEDEEILEGDETEVVLVANNEAEQTARVRSPKYKSIRRKQQIDQQISKANDNAENNDDNKLRPPTIDTANLVNKASPNQLGPPPSPLRPDTPSSTSGGAGGGFGAERNSSTRRAFKKKRRAQGARNSRPTRTQFQVPDESDLNSDDSCDEIENNLAANADSSQQHQHHPKERIVYQFHYHNWASHTCPFIGSLLHFRRRVRICADQMAKSGKTGPTVVHCNDGCGRTGAYLCIDANLELADEDGVYDVFNYTNKLRQSRKFLIENLDQYKFVYDTLEEALFCGKTWFNVGELHQKLKHKSHRNAATKKNDYQIEYEKICRLTSRFSIGDCAGGHRVENREKNRDVSTVPPDNFRPYLTSFQTNDSTDYINAVFVDGYTRSKEYIVTEWPLHRTMSDFWSLVYDHDCNSVILLANPAESSTYPSFLPTEKELRRKFGPVFSAEMVSYTHYQNIKSWIYTINKKIVSLTEVIAGVKSETKTTQVFQITCWPQPQPVPTSTNALVELMNMVERWRQRTTYGPVCVVSLDGKSRAGVYCAANVAIEQVVQHGEVDVFQAVKTVRRHRPQLIENMTEYKYCYDLILHYVLHYLNQSSPNS